MFLYQKGWFRLLKPAKIRLTAKKSADSKYLFINAPDNVKKSEESVAWLRLKWYICMYRLTNYR